MVETNRHKQSLPHIEKIFKKNFGGRGGTLAADTLVVRTLVVIFFSGEGLCVLTTLARVPAHRKGVGGGAAPMLPDGTRIIYIMINTFPFVINGLDHSINYNRASCPVVAPVWSMVAVL